MKGIRITAIPATVAALALIALISFQSSYGQMGQGQMKGQDDQGRDKCPTCPMMDSSKGQMDGKGMMGQMDGKSMMGPMGKGMMGPWSGVNKAVAVIHPTAGSKCQGVVWFICTDDCKVKVIADIQGLTPNGKHGFHIHEFGDCTAPDATSAGGHYNPQGHPHAGPDQAMRHAGDLGNLQADPQGNAHLEMVVDNISIAGCMGPMGRQGMMCPMDGKGMMGQPDGQDMMGQGMMGQRDDKGMMGDGKGMMGDGKGMMMCPMMMKPPILGRSVIIHAQADDLTTQPTGNAGARIGCGIIGIAKPETPATQPASN